MAKKKKKKNQPIGLRDMYEVGDELVVQADVDGEMTKTPVRVTNVGYDCIGIQIIGKCGRRFVKGFEFNIEEIPFRVVNETKFSAVVHCLDENIYTD